MYNFAKRTKEKARQQKQMDKASKRLLAKQHKGITKDTTIGEIITDVIPNKTEEE